MDTLSTRLTGLPAAFRGGLDRSNTVYINGKREERRGEESLLDTSSSSTTTRGLMASSSMAGERVTSLSRNTFHN